jgi:PAS domain S-box-containing protein
VSIATSSTMSPSTGMDPLEKRSLFWSSVGLGMMVAITLIFGWTLRQIQDSDHWVEHTREVISHNRQLLSDIKDAESAERGYIITGDKSYLPPYTAANADILATRSKLGQLVSDNPEQQGRLQHLENLISQRMAVLDEALRQRGAVGFAAAEAVVIAGRGRRVMKEIRNSSQQIEEAENQLLQQRSQLRQRRVQGGFYATIIASLLALVGFVLAPLDVHNALKQRNRAQAVRRESDSTAQALFQAAAQAIFIVDESGRIMMANPAAEKIFGYSPAELQGQTIDLLLPERLRTAHVEHRKHYFAHPQNRPMGMGMDLHARRKDGGEFFAEISLSYIQTAKGMLGVAFLTDISRRRADSDSIRHQKDELRRLTGRLMTAQDDERRRIARDLHDDLSQRLAYLAMDLGKLATKPSAKDLVPDLRPLQLRAADAAETVRRISHQLHPAVLDDIGLEAAMEQYCEEFEERAGIATEFSSRNVPDSLPREIASSVYHIFQECLRNVSKHSRTAAVLVNLSVVDNMLRLAVKDQGVGLSRERAGGEVSIGILGMKERAHLVNGTLTIASQLGMGTEVSVEVPLAPV